MTDLTWRNDSSGRVQPTEYGRLLQPGQCLLCSRIGKNSEEVFANLGVELEFYGIAYLCLECCSEIANFINFKAPQAYESLLDSLTLMRERNASLSAQLEEAKRLIDVRIESAGSISSEYHGDEPVSVPLFEIDDAADEIDRIIEREQSKSSKSGS